MVFRNLILALLALGFLSISCASAFDGQGFYQAPYNPGWSMSQPCYPCPTPYYCNYPMACNYPCQYPFQYPCQYPCQTPYYCNYPYPNGLYYSPWPY
jgi:hypothetical protein